jgi:hypothetical protein
MDTLTSVTGLTNTQVYVGLGVLIVLIIVIMYFGNTDDMPTLEGIKGTFVPPRELYASSSGNFDMPARTALDRALTRGSPDDHALAATIKTNTQLRAEYNLPVACVLTQNGVDFRELPKEITAHHLEALKAGSATAADSALEDEASRAEATRVRLSHASRVHAPHSVFAKNEETAQDNNAIRTASCIVRALGIPVSVKSEIAEVQQYIVDNADVLSAHPVTKQPRAANVREALDALLAMEAGVYVNPLLKNTERNIIAAVWARTKDERNAAASAAMRVAIYDALLACWHEALGTSTLVCGHGRAMCILGALETLDWQKLSISTVAMHRSECFAQVAQALRTVHPTEYRQVVLNTVSAHANTVQVPLPKYIIDDITAECLAAIN